MTDLSDMVTSLEIKFLSEVIDRLFEVHTGRSLPSGMNLVLYHPVVLSGAGISGTALTFTTAARRSKTRIELQSFLVHPAIDTPMSVPTP